MQATTAPGSSAGAFVDKTDLTPGTKVTATDLNAWQAELLHLITEAGLTPDGGDLEQIRKAVQALAKIVKVDAATEADHAAAADDATNSTYATSNLVAGGIGSHAFCANIALTTLNFGDTISGSSLKPIGFDVSQANYYVLGSALTGTWRCLGCTTLAKSTTLFVRIS